MTASIAKDSLVNLKWNFTAQREFFSHDEDPESWDFRATTRPELGLLHRDYPTDSVFDPKREYTQWERFAYYIKHLNKDNPQSSQYKLFYITRHGQGVHNVKEREVGREEWNRHWSKLDGDTTSTWADASLTPTGENQASTLAEFWNTAYTTNKVPIPTTFYTSPLRRCLQTLDLSTGSVLTSLSLPFHPIIKEKAREQIGVHTCDRRSTRSWIAAAYPDWTIEEGFTEEDELWKADVRETYEEQVQRMRELLWDIFESDSESLVVSLTAHSWVLRAIFGATGWRKVPVAAGAVYPLLIKAEKV